MQSHKNKSCNLSEWMRKNMQPLHTKKSGSLSTHKIMQPLNKINHATSPQNNIIQKKNHATSPQKITTPPQKRHATWVSERMMETNHATSHYKKSWNLSTNKSHNIKPLYITIFWKMKIKKWYKNQKYDDLIFNIFTKKNHTTSLKKKQHNMSKNFLAALSSSRSLVVGRSVGWSVCPLVGPSFGLLMFVKKWPLEYKKR